MNSLRPFGFALVLAFAACHAGELAPDGATGDRDGATQTAFGCIAISEGALEGCRASDEPNCGTCCVQAAPDNCTVRGVPCTTVVAGQTVGDYCAVFAMPGQCPADCRPCAACSRYDEASLCSLRPGIDACDCATVDIGLDPCFAPQSCGCLCRTYLADLAACPP
jgi:hypothetical protein